ncbi:MAG: type IX secretion system membrane protein PorP/SprF, partial [Chitinophagales bacterium]
MKILLSLLIALLLPTLAWSQTDPMLNHFMYHSNFYNPAAAGNTDDVFVGVLARQQWTGFDGAPSTQLLNAHAFVPKIKGGVGLTVLNDMLGEERTTTARINYAYRQRLGDDIRLSAGINFGIANYFVKGSELRYQQTGDQSAYNVQEGQVKADVGLGLELYARGFTLGVAVSHLQKSLENATVFQNPRHYFAYARYDWKLSESWVLSPAVFFRNAGFISQADINVNATWNERVVLGAIYRTTDDIAALLGVYVVKPLLLSYSFDFDFGELRTNNSGSHEVSLIARFA